MKYSKQWLNQNKVFTNQEFHSNYKALVKIKRIISEEWICVYKDGNERKSVLYSTEWKNMAADVEKRFKQDYPNCILVEVNYQ